MLMLRMDMGERKRRGGVVGNRWLDFKTEGEQNRDTRRIGRREEDGKKWKDVGWTEWRMR